MNKRIIAVAMAVILVCSLAGVGTMAWFSSRAASSDNRFEVGTLILGGVDADGNDTQRTFRNVEFRGMEPGEPPTKLQSTILKNVGSLPFYIYRLTASSLRDNNDENGKNDTILNEMLLIDVKIGGKHVFHGRLSEMTEENGGHFNPIYYVNPDDWKEMEIYAYLDKAADNNYQGLSMSCDFTVYAIQSPNQLPGSSGEWEFIGTSDTHDASVSFEILGQRFKLDLVKDVNFDVSGKNNPDNMQFKYKWNKVEEEAYRVLGVNIKPYDYVDYYDVLIKHHSGKPNMNLVVRTYPSLRFLEIYIAEDKDVAAGDYGNLSPRRDLEAYVSADANNDILTIDKDIFRAAFGESGDEWEIIDIMFRGALMDGSHNIWTTQYYGWTVK